MSLTLEEAQRLSQQGIQCTLKIVPDEILIIGNPNIAVVTWRFWNTFSSPKSAMQAVRNAYTKGYQFAFRYY